MDHSPSGASAIPAGALRESFRVRVAELTEDNRIALHALVAWLLEGANHHAEALGVGFAWARENRIGWVLARLRVRMDRYPAEGERLEVATWPSALDHRRAFRDFVVREEGPGGAVVGRATSSWALIDIERRRPIEMPAEAFARIPVPGASALTFEEKTIPAPETVAAARPVLVRPSDLDFMGHVNTARLVAWVLDAAHGAVPGTPLQPAELDAVFRAECRLGDTVEARLGADEGGRRRALLTRADGTEIVRATVVPAS